ncbi:aldo/keto reductase [Cryptosporangium phraense]|uniref:Aldo/keto reductase n=1 Tax=Cryptosporangium phraense TaxID=2593070 RepID=A0A545AI53_9ACTN|nr:aldo/keto reductase [Cryptosporangium phraense]TQS40999.1 aldo/keto reductase [Cryptosporangium phraense]
MGNVPNLTLNNGVQIPQLGFGVWQVSSDEIVDALRVALETGYRHVDTAAAYGNEQGVGQAIRDSGVPREDIFITTKLANPDHARAREAFETSLQNLGVDHVDLYLIHWPRPDRGDLYVEAWRELEKVLAEGRARAIGVSNFHQAQLFNLLEKTDVTPAVNQIELHPGFNQDELRAFNAEHGILTEAWSPIGQGQGLLEEPALAKIADEVGRTPAQTVLRWHVQLGNIVFPKSVTPSRIKENFEVFDFELTDAQMDAISALPGHRIGGNPEKDFF